MKKELIICIVIIWGVILGDIFLQQYTSKSLNGITDELIALRNEINENDKFDLNKINKIEQKWDESFNILTCYLEHEELEKIKTQIVIITAGVEVKDKEYAIEEIDRAVYIIEHIETKQMLKLDNIL